MALIRHAELDHRELIGCGILLRINATVVGSKQGKGKGGKAGADAEDDAGEDAAEDVEAKDE